MSDLLDVEFSRHSIRLMLTDEMAADPFETENAPLTLVEKRAKRGALARRFAQRVEELQIVTDGVRTLVSATSELLAELLPVFEKCDPRTALEPAILGRVDAALGRRGLVCGAPQLRLTCGLDTFRPRHLPSDFRQSLAVRPDSSETAGLSAEEWPNAIPDHLDPARPIQLVVTARRADDLVGVATTKADSERVWQLGVDVAEGDRRSGIGSSMVSAVTEFTLAEGRAPLYGLFFGNLPSLRTALSLGYEPIFVEVVSRPANAPSR